MFSFLGRMRDSISARLLVKVFAFYILVTFSVTSVHMVAEFLFEKEDVSEDLDVFLGTFEPGLSIAIWNQEEFAFNQVMKAIVNVPQIVGAVVHDEKGEILGAIGLTVDQDGSVDYFSPDTFEKTSSDNFEISYFSSTADLVFRGDGQEYLVGSLTLFSSTGIVLNRVHYGYVLILINAVIKTIALWVIVMWQSKPIISKPLSEYSKHIESRNLENIGDSKLDLNTRGIKELQMLEDAFNQMAKNVSEAMRLKSEAEQEAKEMEELLRQSQKMESIGQLTGGIAHDFNNLLSIMLGNAEMLEMIIPENDVVKKRLHTIIGAGQRCASLTSRLLAFSRRQELSPVTAEVSELILGLEELLERTLDKTISLEVNLAPDLWRATIDPHQFENAIINLAINGRDAMLGEGVLTIEACNLSLNNANAGQYRELAFGDYVQIAVSDTGSGIPPEILKKVAEPFFTTKEVGKGSGLGLSMVYGFVKQSGGHITISNRENKGAIVKLFFPRA